MEKVIIRITGVPVREFSDWGIKTNKEKPNETNTGDA